jgi:hypothetical protein
MRNKPFLDDAGHLLILFTFCAVFVSALLQLPL